MNEEKVKCSLHDLSAAFDMVSDIAFRNLPDDESRDTRKCIATYQQAVWQFNSALRNFKMEIKEN